MLNFKTYKLLAWSPSRVTRNGLVWMHSRETDPHCCQSQRVYFTNDTGALQQMEQAQVVVRCKYGMLK